MVQMVRLPPIASLKEHNSSIWSKLKKNLALFELNKAPLRDLIETSYDSCTSFEVQAPNYS